MIDHCKEITAVLDPLELLLTEALEKRNWLAHHYFRESSERIISVDSGQKMIDELVEIQSMFQRADSALDEVVLPVRDR